MIQTHDLMSGFRNAVRRIAVLAAKKVTVTPMPTDFPEVDLDATQDLENDATRRRHRNERLIRKFSQVTGAFGRWLSDLISLPTGWETKIGYSANGEAYEYQGIAGAYSIYVASHEAIFDGLYFVMQGQRTYRDPNSGALASDWIYIDSDNALDQISATNLRFGVVAQDGTFLEVGGRNELLRYMEDGLV